MRTQDFLALCVTVSGVLLYAEVGSIQGSFERLQALVGGIPERLALGLATSRPASERDGAFLLATSAILPPPRLCCQAPLPRLSRGWLTRRCGSADKTHPFLEDAEDDPWDGSW